MTSDTKLTAARTYSNCVVTQGNRSFTTDVEVYQREGSLSPAMWVIKLRGKRITPYQQRKEGWEFAINTLFKLVYSRPIEGQFKAMSELGSIWKTSQRR